VRFTDFLKATVFVCAGAASFLAALCVVGAGQEGEPVLVLGAAAWWAIAGVLGLWLGRRAEVNPPITRLLAAARTQPSLPDVRPGRMLVNRLWPLAVVAIAAGAFAFAAPQVPGIAAGFPIIWALTWRRQEAAVTAIEDRDGVRFYVQPKRFYERIELVRTPGFKATAFELEGERTVLRAP
jgi:hypothetical protein